MDFCYKVEQYVIFTVCLRMVNGGSTMRARMLVVERRRRLDMFEFLCDVLGLVFGE